MIKLQERGHCRGDYLQKHLLIEIGQVEPAKFFYQDSYLLVVNYLVRGIDLGHRTTIWSRWGLGEGFTQWKGATNIWQEQTDDIGLHTLLPLVVSWDENLI